jgi:zinc transport system permease protein
VLALQTVGVLMAIALFVVPAAAARLWTQTAEAMSALAALLGLAAALGGLHLAYHLATPPGATVALVAVALLGASVAATLPRRARRPAAHAAELPGAR